MDNNCLNCALADWTLTKSARLHPSGEGKCKFVFKMPELPKSLYFVGGIQVGGGFINRNTPETDCPQFIEDIFRSKGKVTQ